ncbi:39S ribosomal protein L39, mitochondrial-like [Ctenocephalides felis]|uniref:39S ribosomal protein L39, mitochondrial-like n=1 Tax=Ctenocephalides felis TaxID=7515 RepID=UPI000E6E46F7|nr:39S ribosomal protein L39, mitochondrial-like [Ctenocephalides felis]
MLVSKNIQLLCRRVFKNSNKIKIQQQCERSLSSLEAKERRNELFTLEKKRQREDVGRIEKIEVRYLGTPEDVTLVMNKNLSTPFNCAQHLSEVHTQRALALIDGHTPWDMHRPLEDTCTLQLLNFTVAEPQMVNKAYWRTCSFLLGALVQNVFKDDIPVFLHSFPGPNIRSGSFVHDFELGIPDWKPTPQEMYALSAEMIKFCSKSYPIERLDISGDLALEMFKENKHKTKQIPSILHQSGIITVYRAGTHVDISRGPMISNTNLLGKTSIMSLHKITNTDTVSEGGQLYRLQGVSLPKELMMNHFAYGIIEDRARQLNTSSRMPHEPYAADEPRPTPVEAIS